MKIGPRKFPIMPWIKVCKWLGLSAFQLLNAQHWEIGIPLPDSAQGRHHAVAFAIDGYGYVGLGNGPNSLLDDMYKFDPMTNEWTALKKFPGGKRGFSIGVEHWSKGWVGFGYNNNGELMNDLWQYNPYNDSWRKLANCPCEGRIHPAFVALAGKLYVGLGEGLSGNLRDWWEYDILSDTWTRKADFPSAQRHHPYQFSIYPYAYVGMGHGAGIYNDLYRYDPENDEWKEMENLPGEGRVAGTQFGYNGKGYILSGQGDDHDYMDEGEFFEFDPVRNNWRKLPPHPKNGSRWAPSSFVIEDKLYLTCGQDRLVYNKDVMVYHFQPVDTKNPVDTDWRMTPNPVLQSLTVQSSVGIVRIEVSSLDGKVLKCANFGQAMQHSIALPLADLPAGLYCMAAVLDNGTKRVSKFQKL